MRVMHVAETIFGGVGSYLDDVGSHQMQRFGVQNVLILTPPGGTRMLPSIDRRQILELDGAGRSALGLARLGRAASRHASEFGPDIIHLHSTFAGLAGRFALRLSRSRARIVYCPHGWAFGMAVGRGKKQLYAGCERLLAAWSDAIIVNSESERILAQSYGIPPEKLQVVRNGVPPMAEARPRSARPRINLAFVGRHDRQKGLDILLKELDRPDCEHLHLHVVGGNVVSPESPLLSRPLKNVTFYGWMARDRIAALLETMDVMVVPSRWEAFGLVAIEAMACGLPVIASNKGGLPETVRHGVDGLVVDIDKSGELGRTLASLTKEQLKLFARSARGRYLAEFTAERMNGELAAAYDLVLKEPSLRRTQLLSDASGTPAE